MEGLVVKRILGLLGWLGVVLVLAAVAIRFLRPDPTWQAWSQALALAGLVVTALYALSPRRDIGRSFQGRCAKYGSAALGAVLVLLAFFVSSNWISSRQNKRWDMTSAKQVSTSDETRSVLRTLSHRIEVLVFDDAQTASHQV